MMSGEMEAGMRQSVPTVTAWLDRQKPPMPVTHEVTLPEGVTKLLVSVSLGGCGGSHTGQAVVLPDTAMVSRP